MSGRGRGRGGRTGGGGRGGSGRDQPPPAQSSGGGGRGLPQSSPRGRGGGGGRGPIGQAPSQQAPRPQPQPQQPAVRPVSPIAASPAATSSVASSSTASTLSHEVQRKLTLKPPVQTAKMPVQKSTTSNLPPASSKAIQMPPRPGYGKLGQRCIVRANHFLVTVADTTDLHHYDVAINPEVTNKKVRRSIMTELDNTFRLSHLGDKILAYDGSKSAYSPGPLPFASKDFVVKLQDKKDGGASRERDFKVSIKFAAKADLHHLKEFLASRQLDVPQETIQALDVVLRALPSQDCSVVGRSFFHEQFGRGELGEGLKFWKGFYQSLRPTQMGLSLNIDISARAFYEHIPVTDFVGKFLNRELTRILADQERVKLKKAMRGIRVEFRHKEYVRRYKVLSLSLEPMNRLTFQDINGERITVVQYFRQKYNIALRYTHLPALNAGSDAKPTYIPMEVCTIVDGQRYLKKLNERQVANLLKATCERPHLREKSIETMVGHNNYKDQKIVKDFGIVVNTALANVEARVLAPPRLLYNSAGKDSYVEPRVGQWNMINKKMINGGRVETWSCVSFSRMRFDIVDAFVDELLSMCSSRGMAFNPQPVVPVHSANPRDIEKELIDIHSEAEKKAPGKFIQLLIIILPDISGSYGKIKRICETELGIVSQCCQPKQAQKCNRQYLENLSLKINVKVGGRNTVLESAMSKKIQFVSEVPTIIFGADVTHPAPGQDSSPSIAAVVASMDWPEITKYRGLVSAQGHRDEMIKDLYRTYEDPQKGTVIVSMIRELMIQFRVATGQKPLRIIFYRDGVSEGQFSHVLLLEMDAIRKACQSLEGGYLPPVTFVVVQKRHHTRLFPANHNDQRTTDKSGNILPGTVVDTSICHPSEFDFYLCSHAGIQGTSRPTHYHVLYDENRFSADGLQSLTNNLCYTYARCTRSVSIVPPAFYAHLAAFRARYYVEGDETTENEENTGGGSGGRAASTREGNLEVRPLPAIRDNVKAVMFYC